MMFVFTSKSGEVIASFEPRLTNDPNVPKFRPINDPKSDITIHEVEAPPYIQSITSAKELSKEFKKLIKSNKSKLLT